MVSKYAVSNVVKPTLGKVVQSGASSTLSEVDMSCLFQAKVIAETFVKSVLSLSYTGFIILIADIVEKIVDRAVDEEQPEPHGRNVHYSC